MKSARLWCVQTLADKPQRYGEQKRDETMSRAPFAGRRLTDGDSATLRARPSLSMLNHGQSCSSIIRSLWWTCRLGRKWETFCFLRNNKKPCFMCTELRELFKYLLRGLEVWALSTSQDDCVVQCSLGRNACLCQMCLIYSIFWYLFIYIFIGLSTYSVILILTVSFCFSSFSPFMDRQSSGIQ